MFINTTGTITFSFRFYQPSFPSYFRLGHVPKRVTWYLELTGMLDAISVIQQKQQVIKIFEKRPHHCHTWRVFPILYNGPPVPRQNCPFPWGIWSPTSVHIPRASQSVQLLLQGSGT